MMKVVFNQLKNIALQDEKGITRPMQTANTGGDANSVHANAQRL
jgi:hypothetical protein